MVKKICISISDYVYDTYLSEIKDNRSRAIEKFIMTGAEAEINKGDNYKAKLTKSIAEISKLKFENNKLRAELGRNKSLIDSYRNSKKKTGVISYASEKGASKW